MRNAIFFLNGIGSGENNRGVAIGLAICFLLFSFMLWEHHNHNHKLKTDPVYAQEFKLQVSEWEAQKKERVARETQVRQEKILARTPFVDKELYHDFKLRKMKLESINSFEAKAMGSFFLIAGNYEKTELGKEQLMVRFSWERSKNFFINSTIPFTKIRENLDFEAQGATIKFIWQDHPVEMASDTKGCWSPQWQDENSLISKCLKYAVVTCSPNDWPKKINLPLN